MNKDINILAVKEELSSNRELANHIKDLLKNTRFNVQNIDDLTVGALNKAYTFANTNIKVANEVGIPITPLYKSTISRRKLDFELVSLIDKHSNINSVI